MTTMKTILSLPHPKTRDDLQTYLQTITELPEERVLYQPPEGAKFKYPAITYRLSDLDQTYASNINYKQNHCYEITVISANPDSKYEKLFSKLPRCRFLRHFQSDNLDHWVYRFWTTK